MRPFDFCHLLLLAAAVFLLLPSAAPDISSDRAALLSLRSAVGGRVLLWNLSSPSPCTWAGVTCSPENSSVIELRLPGMGLSGRIPANTISSLTSLQTLSLRYNSLSGPLPANLFSSLSSLRNLYMQHNAFTGMVPDSLFSLSSSLVRVNLAANNFAGPISPAFDNLKRLATLYLHDNEFSGPIPDLNLPGLVQFNVSNNNLIGRIPKGLSGKPKNSFLGNSLYGCPLDSCGGRKKLSGGAVAGIVIGSVVGVFLILSLLVLCWRRVMLRRWEEDEVVEGKEREVEIPGESDVVSEGNGGKRSLVYFGDSHIRGWDFDMEDLLRASAEVLGKGTFGTTYKAVVETGVAVVVKRLRDVCIGEKEFREKMVEIGRMEHQNLLPLRAYYYNKDEKLLVYEYMPMGSLSALLHGNKGVGGRTPLNWETRATIALGAARGISYLHSQSPSLSHGNIKSSNILLTKSYKARVSDILLARLATPAAANHHLGGSYRAPEVTDPHKVSQKADVYSFGVVLLELLTCKAPTPEDGVDLPRWVQSLVREEWMNEVFDLELLRYQNVGEDMVQLLQLAVDCTAHYPDKRPSMVEVAAKIEELCRWSVEDGRDIVGVGEDENDLHLGLSPI